MPFRFPPPPRPVLLRKAAPTPGQLAQLHAIANRLEPRVAREFEAAMQDLAYDLDIEAFIRAVQDGDARAAQQVIDQLPIEGRLLPAVNTITSAFQSGALLAQSQARAVLGPVRFDLTNPAAIAWSEANSARMVTDVSESTIAALRAVTRRALRGELTMPEAARQIRPLVGLTERDARAVDNLRASMLEQGAKPSRIESVTNRYAAKLHRARAQNIARTEIIDASAAGQQALWDQGVSDGLIDPAEMGQKWVCSDGACAKICAPMNGQWQPLGGLFTTGDRRQIPRPTAHPRCRCGIVLAPRS